MAQESSTARVEFGADGQPARSQLLRCMDAYESYELDSRLAVQQDRTLRLFDTKNELRLTGEEAKSNNWQLNACIFNYCRPVCASWVRTLTNREN